MRKYYEKLERCEYLSPAEVIATGHGSSGWLVTEKSDTSGSPQDWQLQTTLQYAVGAAGQAYAMAPIDPLLDPNTRKVADEGQEGYLTIPLATANHARNGPREFIRQIAAQFPENLTIWTGVYVTQILFADGDENVATGVKYLAGRNLYSADPNSGLRCKVTNPTPGEIHAAREVILACGTFNTPQLLMLSGIGPKEHLAEHGIPVRVDLPGVGRNLQDRYEVGVVFEMASDWTVNADATFDDDPDFDAALAQWQATRTGVYTSSGSALAFLKRSKPDAPDPDLFVFALAAHFQGYFPRYFSYFEPVRNQFTWAVLKAHTRNTAGEVKLETADPFDRPYVNFRYFEEGNDADGDDIAAVVEAVGFARSVMKGSPYVMREVLPGPDVQGNEALAQWVRDQAWGHHCSCTCKIGRSDDPQAVLDGDFRVRGTKNLRVVDASVFPHIPGTFIVLPIYMISEKAATVIIAEARGAATSGADLMPSTVPATNSSARGGIL